MVRSYFFPSSIIFLGAGVMFINTTQIIGVILLTGTEQTTGSMVLSLGMIVLLLIAIATLFGIPLEFTAFLILPLLLSIMAYYGNFVAVGIVFLIYIALVFTKKFLFK